MFHRDNINGENLKEKQLCLTFDDGPGIYTLPIALFLNQYKIRATFFVVGKYAIENIDTLSKLKALGHIVANHTFEHPDLPYYCSINGDIQDQIIRCNSVIKPFLADELVFFRAPYGKWSSEVADELNQNLKSSMNMCGPIHWEIPGIDCHFWNIGKSVEEAVDAYLSEISSIGKGIVVMHDDIADMDIVKSKNQTFELVKLLIPILIDQGYQFVGLDEIEGLREKELEFNAFYLKAGKNTWIQQIESGFVLENNGKFRSDFRLIEYPNGKIGLKTRKNLYLAADAESNTLFTSEIESEHTQFDYIPVRGNGFLLRAFNGNFLQANSPNGNVLNTGAQFMRQASILYYTPVHHNIQQKVTFKTRLKMAKKAIMFVKSKLLSR
jgi:peptidoglycan/xylan/chitin deacetylase (PgdA/CDA1 family)